MPDVVNTQIIKLVSEGLRPAANLLAQLYYASKAVSNWATAINAAGLLPNDATYIIKDGSQENGNPILNGKQAYDLFITLDTIRAELEANNNQKLMQVLGAASVQTPRF